MAAPSRLSVTDMYTASLVSIHTVINDASPVKNCGSSHVRLPLSLSDYISFPAFLFPFTIIVVCLPITYQRFFGFFSSVTGIEQLWQFPSRAMTFAVNLSVLLLLYIRDLYEACEMTVSLLRHKFENPIRNAVVNVRRCGAYWSAVTSVFTFW